MSRTLQKSLNRDRILTEGVNLLIKQGYHGTGLKEILTAVQIPKGSFYNYFTSKEAFAAEVVQHYIEPFIQRLEAHLNVPDRDAITSLQIYLNDLINDLEQAGYEGGCLLGNLMAEMGDTSKPCRLSLKSALARYRDLYIRALSKGQQQGRIRTDKSAEVMADLLIDGFQGALLRMKIEKSTTPLKRCCHELLGDFFCS